MGILAGAGGALCAEHRASADDIQNLPVVPTAGIDRRAAIN
jgi:hypothetical protein